MLQNDDLVPLSVDLPPRSRLGRLEPIARGTAYRESLSSFVLRLAHNHHLAPHVLYRQIIAPDLKALRSKPAAWDVYPGTLSSFDGIGVVAEAWAQVIAGLTGHRTLIDLTLAPYKEVLSQYKLLNSQKRWCPCCISESVASGSGYGQLLWQIAAVTACPKHGIRLVSTCEYCGSVGSVSHKVRQLPHVCPHCGHELGGKAGTALEPASPSEVARAKLVADFLQSSPEHCGSLPKFGDFLRNLMAHCSDGCLTQFGKLVGVRKNTLHGWLNAHHSPSFPEILCFASACNTQVTAVLSNQVDLSNLRVAQIRFEPRLPIGVGRVAFHRVDHAALRAQLLRLENEEPPLSVNQAALQAGVSARTVRGVYPEIARRLADRRAKHLASQRRSRLDGLVNAARETALRLAADGQKPTRRAVEKELLAGKTMAWRDGTAVLQVLRALRENDAI